MRVSLLILLIVTFCHSGGAFKLNTKRLSLIVRNKHKAVDDGIPFKDKILAKSNEFRKKHGAPPLVWDAGIAVTAQKWADHLAGEDAFYHSTAGDLGLGENLYYSTGAEWKMGDKAPTRWYEEIKDYDFNNPAFGHLTGHFTQLVWVDSHEVGCGIATSASKKHYVCCNYSPPGNYAGEFEQNVLPANSLN